MRFQSMVLTLVLSAAAKGKHVASIWELTRIILRFE